MIFTDITFFFKIKKIREIVFFSFCLCVIHSFWSSFARCLIWLVFLVPSDQSGCCYSIACYFSGLNFSWIFWPIRLLKIQSLSILVSTLSFSFAPFDHFSLLNTFLSRLTIYSQFGFFCLLNTACRHLIHRHSILDCLPRHTQDCTILSNFA